MIMLYVIRCCVPMVEMNGTVLEPNAATGLKAIAAVNSLSVSWSSPVSGLVEQYEIQLKNQATTKQTTPHSTREATFFNLTAGTPYTVIVVALSGRQRSDKLERMFYTSEFNII